MAGNVEICLIMYAAINTDWWFTCTKITAEEFTVSKSCYCLWTRPVYVYTDLVARQTRRNPWKPLRNALLSGRPKMRVCRGLEPKTVSHIDPLLMVHVMGFPRALATVARFPERKNKEINSGNRTQSACRLSIEFTNKLLSLCTLIDHIYWPVYQKYRNVDRSLVREVSREKTHIP
jgi:hypothetical protein